VFVNAVDDPANASAYLMPSGSPLPHRHSAQTSTPAIVALLRRERAIAIRDMEFTAIGWSDVFTSVRRSVR